MWSGLTATTCLLSRVSLSTRSQLAIREPSLGTNGGTHGRSMRIFETTEHLRVALDYHVARHNVLASNLAHIDTPGYKPIDLERRERFEGALDLAMRATDAKHFGAPSAQ